MPPVVRCETRTAFIRLGRLAQAEHVTASALDVLERVASPAEPSETLSLYGAMHLVQAVISGQESDRSRAHQHLAEAKRIGEQLGSDRNDFETEFGHTNVQLHAVAVAIDLGDAGEALDVARGIDASGLSPERQARLLVDVARAHGQRRHTGEAAKALLDAECLAPSTFGLTTWSTARSGTSSTSSDGELRPTWSNSHVEAEQCGSAESPVGGDVLGEPFLITVAAATPRPHVSHDEPGSRL